MLEQKYVQDDSQTVKVGCCCSIAAAGWAVCPGCGLLYVLGHGPAACSSSGLTVPDISSAAWSMAQLLRAASLVSNQTYLLLFWGLLGPFLLPLCSVSFMKI